MFGPMTAGFTAVEITISSRQANRVLTCSNLPLIRQWKLQGRWRSRVAIRHSSLLLTLTIICGLLFSEKKKKSQPVINTDTVRRAGGDTIDDNSDGAVRHLFLLSFPSLLSTMDFSG